MRGDWIKLHRRMLDSELMRKDWLCRLWIWCLLRANFAEQHWQEKKLDAGQFITGRFTGAEELGVSPSRFWRGLKRLAELQNIILESDTKRTTVTICNWKTYQLDDEQERTANGQPADNERTTNGQPADTIEECKKERMEEEETSSLRSDVFAAVVTEEPAAKIARELFTRWNLIRGFRGCQKLSGKRLKSLRERIKDPHWRENWPAALDQAARSSFLRGGGGSGWKADVDWFLRPDSVLRILEGKYDDAKPGAKRGKPADDTGRFEWTTGQPDGGDSGTAAGQSLADFGGSEDFI